MKKRLERLLTALLATALVCSLTMNVRAADGKALDAAVADTAKYVYETVAKPQVDSIGGEWAVLGLARSGYAVPESYYQGYYAVVEQYVKDHGGVLHNVKYTEYSRVIVALSAIGKDARNVAGYDLTKPLGDFDKTIWQGINGPVWALIALDSAGYPMPQNSEAATQATREMYVDEILSRQLSDGGFSLTGGTRSASAGDAAADPDITGMALQALAKYQNRKDVKEVIQEALACLSKLQDTEGGYASWGTKNCESVVQVIVALNELGIPLDDPRFVKNGRTLLDNLLTYYRQGKGFVHTSDGGGVDQMSTEQGLYALVSAQRAQNGKSSLYRMDDALPLTDAVAAETKGGGGLPGKLAEVQSVPVTKPGATFPDLNGYAGRAAVEALASRGVVTGRDDGSFQPEGSMTRAEFTAIVVRALGLTPKADGTFADVASGAWYAPYVGTAHQYGIVNGSNGAFRPDGTITRQEAAVMVAGAARLCGLDTLLDAASVRDTLAQFPDYLQSGEWARASLAFCYQEGILKQEDLNIRPAQQSTRGEIAQMLYALLETANLL